MMRRRRMILGSRTTTQQYRMIPNRLGRVICLQLFYLSSVLAQNLCRFTTEDGSILTFQRGESVHAYRPNRCTNSESFPCYCNPDIPGQVECPYCWVPTISGDLLCVEDSQSITYTNLEGSAETCVCQVSDTEINVFAMDCQPPSQEGRQEDSSTTSTDVCTFNGITFERGQVLGFAHDSGCSGSSFDYQCLCNPDYPDGIECPFCFFDVQNSDEKLCLRDGEIATFHNPVGQIRTCGCTVPVDGDGKPHSDCSLRSGSANMCVLKATDGSIETFRVGEPLSKEVSSRCGPDYPCYCQPTMLGQTWCPYCIYQESQNSFKCAADGETTTHFNMKSGQTETCSCEVPQDSNQAPISTCTPSTTSTGQQAGMTRNGDTTQEEVPLDTPTTTDDSWRVCEFDGNLFFEGENVGSNFETRCGSFQEFPCFCNPDVNPPVDCPYCGFALTKENLLCLKHEQVASFVDIDGDEMTCGCVAPVGTSRPMENCLLPTSAVNTCVFRDSDGNPFVFNVGDPIDDDLLPASVCGPDFPCYCDPKAEDQLSCPFCETVDFAGVLICAADGDSAFFEEQDGSRKRCVCEVPDNLLEDEPKLNCDDDAGQITDDDNFNATSPTSAPNEAQTCSILSPTGETVEIPDGDSFGDLAADGVCGSSDDWPAFCNAEGAQSGAINAQIEYPYCIFENTESGTPTCARDQESVTFVDDTGTEVECSCTYDTEAQTSCTPQTEQSVVPPTARPTTTPEAPGPSNSATRATLSMWGAMGMGGLFPLLVMYLSHWR